MAKKILVELDVNNNKITNVAHPVNNGDAVNKDYINETLIDLLNIGEWVYDSSLTVPPTSGTFRTNNASLTLSTQLHIHYDDNNSFVADFILSRLLISSSITIQQTNDSDNWIKYKITTTTDNTTYFTFDVTNIQTSSIGVPTGICKILFNENIIPTLQDVTQNGATTDQHVLFEDSFALYDTANASEVSFNPEDGGYSVINGFQASPMFIIQSDISPANGTTLGLGTFGNRSSINTSLLTGDRIHSLPNNSGVIALLIDITNAVSASISGTINYVPKFTSANVIGNSQIFDNGTNVGIGTISTPYKLTVNGDIKAVAGSLYADNIKAVGGSLYADNLIALNGGTNIGQQLEMGSAVASTLLFRSDRWRVYSSQTGYEILSILKTGNVGINTITSNSKLEVKAGGATSTDRVFAARNSADTFDLFKILGDGSVFSNGPTGASYNTMYGESVGLLTTGVANTFFGYRAGFATTTGAGNIAIGWQAMLGNTTGALNTAIGYGALLVGTNNTNTVAIGGYAFRTATGLGAGVAIGYLAAYSNTSGNANNAIGTQAGYSNTTGNNNVFIGDIAARYLADGTTSLTKTDNSIYIGYNSKANVNNPSNEIVIGYNAVGGGSDTATIGNTKLRTVLSSGDYEVLVSTRGIVLKSPDNNRWRITIDNTGTLITTMI